jgi:hypothetical protein
MADLQTNPCGVEIKRREDGSVLSTGMVGGKTIDTQAEADAYAKANGYPPEHKQNEFDGGYSLRDYNRKKNVVMAVVVLMFLVMFGVAYLIYRWIV